MPTVGVARTDCEQDLLEEELGLLTERYLYGIAQAVEQNQGVLDSREFEVQRFGVPIPQGGHRSSTVAGTTQSRHGACGRKQEGLLIGRGETSEVDGQRV